MSLSGRKTHLDRYRYTRKEPLTGQLHCSALKGIISLIPKKGKDLRKVRHLRPISLLETDYKLVEKVLANRLKPALEEIINQDQKGFLKGRHIGCNIRRILDLIQYAEDNQIEASLLLLDFEKCFDRVEIKALLAALKYFGVGESYLKWTKLIYTNSKSCVMNNGFFSEWFNVTRSLRQGGPNSAYYFLVVAEILAIELRKNTHITGILINDVKKILGQFADDMDLYLLGEESIVNAVETIRQFEKHSGFRMSYEKTVLYRIGSLSKAKAKMYTVKNIRWCEEDINVLGVQISKLNDLQKINYESILNKVNATLNVWRGRNLSLCGKILIVNTLTASLFTYKMLVLPKIKDNYVKKFEQLVNDFLWLGRKPKITLKTLQKSKGDGGLGLIDLRMKDTSLKTNWVNWLEEDDLLSELAFPAALRDET